MSPVGFEPTILGGERPKTYALDRTATGTVRCYVLTDFIESFPIWDFSVSPLLHRNTQTGMEHFATTLLIIRRWQFWDSNMKIHFCPILPPYRESVVLFEGSQALLVCPGKWSIEMKQCEARTKWYWQGKYKVLCASPVTNRLICGMTLEKKPPLVFGSSTNNTEAWNVLSFQITPLPDGHPLAIEIRIRTRGLAQPSI